MDLVLIGIGLVSISGEGNCLTGGLGGEEQLGGVVGHTRFVADVGEEVVQLGGGHCEGGGEVV